MQHNLEQLIEDNQLQRVREQIVSFVKPTIGFSPDPEQTPSAEACSRFGGIPRLPRDFQWPANNGRPLDFLLQIDLAEITDLDRNNLLPAAGVLSFFYDLEEQPWGFDPKDLQGFAVHYNSEPASSVLADKIDDINDQLPECSLQFYPMQTLPRFDSWAGERFMEAAKLDDREWDRFDELAEQCEEQVHPEGAGNHHLLGHSANVQGDMQLEAQLVTNGLYCGDPSGYEDPRAKELEPGAGDWVLLLQFDSDDRLDLMWGDCGMLYYWIRKNDLAHRNFDRVWMTMQCY